MLYNPSVQCTSVQSLSRVQLLATPRAAAHQASLSIASSQSLLKLMSIESVMPSNHLILCHPLLLPPSIFPSIRVFSNESALRIRRPKYWSFSLNISPFSGYNPSPSLGHNPQYRVKWRRKWQPTPVLMPRKFHGWRSLMGYTVHGVAKSRTRLNDFTFTFTEFKLSCSLYN